MVVNARTGYNAPMTGLTDFIAPRFTDALDVEGMKRLVPANATCKGLVAESALDALRAARLPLPPVKFVAFRDYPLIDVMDLFVAAAITLSPGVPLRTALRTLGNGLFPKFTNSLLGRVMYGVFGGNVMAILRLANKSFEQTQNTGKLSTHVLDRTSVRLGFSTTYTFLDSYHVGVVEGTLKACGVDGEVLVKMTSPTDGDMLVRWTPKS